eukprot:9941524-Alexandrium_andersonii.AAC.1
MDGPAGPEAQQGREGLGPRGRREAPSNPSPIANALFPGLAETKFPGRRIKLQRAIAVSRTPQPKTSSGFGNAPLGSNRSV